MNPEEPPRGGRMLEQAEDDADAIERKPAPHDEPALMTEELSDAKPRRAPRKRRKPFVL
jgi:hypothetical protein